MSLYTKPKINSPYYSHLISHIKRLYYTQNIEYFHILVYNNRTVGCDKNFTKKWCMYMVKIIRKGESHIYTMLESTVISEDFDTVTVYGISIADESQKAEVTDISDNFNFVYGLFDLIVEEELYPEHLQNVVEDFLSDCCPKIISFPKSSDTPLQMA